MVNTTVLNVTTTSAADQAYLPFEIWLVLVAMWLIFFLASIWGTKFTDIMAALSTVMAAVCAFTVGMVSFAGTLSQEVGSELVIVPYSYNIHPTYLGYLFMMFFLVGIVNTYRIVLTNKRYQTLEDQRKQLANPYIPWRNK